MLLAAGDCERANTRSARRRTGLQEIASEPEGAIVRRVDGDVGVVLPSETVRLRRLPLGQDRFVEGELALWVAGRSRGEPLACIIRIAAEGIADPDVAPAVHPH